MEVVSSCIKHSVNIEIYSYVVNYLSALVKGLPFLSSLLRKTDFTRHLCNRVFVPHLHAPLARSDNELLSTNAVAKLELKSFNGSKLIL